MVETIDLTEEFWEAGYLPIARQQRFATQRITLPVVRPYQSAILGRTWVWKEQWANLAGYTEAAWVQRALAGQWPAPMPLDLLCLVCRPNFDIYIGKAGVYRERLGNLKQDGVAKPLPCALGRTLLDREQFYYRQDEFLAIDKTVSTFLTTAATPIIMMKAI